MAMAVEAAGIRTPRLRTARQVDQDTALLAYDHLDAPRVADLPDRAWTPGLHGGIWALWQHLRSRQLAHRELTTDHLRLDASGGLWLTDVGYGEIAAEDLLCRLDGAELLVSLALRVGPARATEEAVDALGPDTAASLLPLMQPILFSEDTAKALRRHRAAGGRADIVGAIRDRIIALHPEADVQPVSLERVRPRTVLSIVGGTIAFYLLATQLTGFQVPELDTWQAWGWVLGAAVASASPTSPPPSTCSAASRNACPVAHHRYRPGRRGLRRTGRPGSRRRPGRQHPLPATRRHPGGARRHRRRRLAGHRLRVLPGAAAGVQCLRRKATGKKSGGLSAITPSATVTGVIIALAVIGLLVAAIPRLRAVVVSRVKPLVTDIGPEFLQVARTPRKLAQAFGGAVGLPLAATVCLWASVNAVSGSEVNLAAMGVAYLVAKAVGSLVPTPGGIGGVEAVLTAGLTAAGVPSATAATSVIVFRLLTWWLPVIPGWFAFTALQRRGAL